MDLTKNSLAQNQVANICQSKDSRLKSGNQFSDRTDKIDGQTLIREKILEQKERRTANIFRENRWSTEVLTSKVWAKFCQRKIHAPLARKERQTIFAENRWSTEVLIQHNILSENSLIEDQTSNFWKGEDQLVISAPILKRRSKL